MSVITTGVIIVVLIAGYMMNRVLNFIARSVPAPSAPLPEQRADQPLHDRLQDLLLMDQTYGPKADPATVPARPMPDDIILIPGIDMNGDGQPETLSAQRFESEFSLSPQLIEAGFYRYYQPARTSSKTTSHLSGSMNMQSGISSIQAVLQQFGHLRLRHAH